MAKESAASKQRMTASRRSWQTHGSWVVLVLVLWAAGRAHTQQQAQRPSATQAGAAGEVQLQRRGDRDLGDGVSLAMFPRVLTGPAVSASAAERINRSLALFNADVTTEARECGRAEVRMNQESSPDFNRTIEVTMQGPRFLSLVAEDIYSCGAPHPLDAELALVFDLKTGLPVNWTRYLPPDAVGHLAREKGHPAIGYITWPRMMERVRTHASDSGNTAEECAGAYRDPQTAFNIWLDAKDRAIVFSPQLNNHFDTAMCSQQLEIDAKAGKELGIAIELLNALQI